MSKHSISTRETQVGIGNTVGKQVEQTVFVGAGKDIPYKKQ